MKRSIHAFIIAVLVAAGASVLTTQSAVPTPESVIGWAPCADYKLATYEQIDTYFRALADSSDRMQLIEIGKTAEGRTQTMAIISSEANMRNLDRYKEIARTLAQGQVSETTARALANEGKAVVWIDFGLHSTEVAHGQTAPWMAHNAVSDESEEMRNIRDNVIFLLVPNMNPDGTTLVANWYMQHVGTEFEHASLPELYQKYVGHDNNRDWYMFNQPESRNVGRQLYEEWFPQIIYNQHQTGPFPSRIFIPPFAEPVNPNIPALVMRGINAVGSAMGRRYDQEGKTGVISQIGYDTWWNGGMRTAPYYHNMVGILTEASHASATPATYDRQRFPPRFSNGESTTEPSTFYPNPYLGGEWHIRDTCEYMLTGSMAVLDIGAKRRVEWLYNIYQMGRDAIAAGEDETYVISLNQWDPGTAIKLVNVLRRGGIEVDRATVDFILDGIEYPSGSFVVAGAQAFRPHLTDLLNPQVYPDRRLYPGGPPDRPYDITGWTLPFQMDVNVAKHSGLGNQRAEVALEPVVGLAQPPSHSMPDQPAGAYVIDTRANDAFIAVNRLLAAGETIYRTTTVVDEGVTYDQWGNPVDTGVWPAGTFLVAVGLNTHARVADAASSLGLTISALDALPSTGTVQLTTPRIGLYHAWGGNMDEGWTRWLLEQFEFPYTSLHDAEVRTGNLYDRYDVIVLPDATYQSMLHGLSAERMPVEYTGGMMIAGLANLHEFVTAGGTLVAMDTATELPLEIFDLPISDVTVSQSDSDYYIPGTLLRMAVDNTHPLAFGMPEESTAFFARSPAFSIGRAPSRAERWTGTSSKSPESIRTVASYPSSPDELLKSGWLLGGNVIAGRAAVVEVAIKEGRIVLLGFRVQHRAQSHGTFKLLFNSLLISDIEAN
jgi:hypothetical protein